MQQAQYVDWKFLMLQNFVRTAPRRSGNGYYFRTVTHPSLTQLAKVFYDDDVKRVPIDVLKSDFPPLSLAVWIMDDGASDGRQLRINTQSFSAAEAHGLSEFLEQRFQLKVAVNFDKGKPRLRIAAESMKKLKRLVDPFILPGFRYKLPP